MPGENIYDWSVTAITNGSADSSINWREGMPRGDVNNSARAMMAAQAKVRNLQNASIVTTGTANAQSFSSGMNFTDAPPTGMRVLLKIGAALTNTDAATLNMDSIGDVTIKRQGGADLSSNDMRAGGYADLLYDGTNWILLRETRTSFPSAVLISTTEVPVITPAPTATITGLTAAFNEYRIVITNLVASTLNTKLVALVSVDGGSTFLNGASDYAWTQFRFDSATNATPTGAFNDDFIEMTPASVSNIPSMPVAGEVRIYAPSLAVSTNIQWTLSYENGSQTAYLRIDGAGRQNPALSMEAIQFSMSSGNIATGIFQLYGIHA